MTMEEPKGKENPAFDDTELQDRNQDLNNANEKQIQINMDELERSRNQHYPNGNIPVDEDDDDDESGEDLVLRKKEFKPEEHNACARGLMVAQKNVIHFYKQHSTLIWRAVLILTLLAYLAYFAYALYYKFGDEGSIRLLVCTIFGMVLLVKHLLRHHMSPFEDKMSNFLSSASYQKHRIIIRWVLYVCSTILTVTLIIVIVALDTPENLLSLAGLAAFLVICTVTSYNPAMINWHPIFWGFQIQFYFAIIILKTRWGYQMFDWLGVRITEFLAYSETGARFVFGDTVTINIQDGNPLTILNVYTLHYFAFALMPIITFFSTIISILYYLGVMQSIIVVTGSFLSFCLGTTPAESLNAAGNIFVSMTESPLMIRPFIPKMTRSELHAVMVGGFASIAGGVLGAYIGFGVPADHLLSASVMSAPAALAVSKITYPEVDELIVKPGDYEKMEKATEGNVIEAACNGAIASGKLIAAVVLNVMAFLSLLKFLNATLTWFGDRVGVKGLTFELICSYVLYPVALFMGTEPDDCRQVAELVGIKTFTNEFIAYVNLAKLIKNRKTYLDYVNQYGEGYTHMDRDDLILEKLNGTRLIKGIMSHRSEVISTYALCGFSNFGSMGILLGSLSAMAPRRRPTMAKLIMRAMIAGNVACFFTACIAGLFYEKFD